jgi:nitrogen regulatory protein P-II 1
MKEIKAIIQPAALNKVLLALHEIKGLPGCTVSHVHGYRRTDKTAAELALEPRERVKLELVVRDADLARVLKTIEEAARTGQKGDGKVFVMDCEQVVRIRTGERGDQAI